MTSKAKVLWCPKTTASLDRAIKVVMNGKFLELLQQPLNAKKSRVMELTIGWEEVRQSMAEEHPDFEATREQIAIKYRKTQIAKKVKKIKVEVDRELTSSGSPPSSKDSMSMESEMEDGLYDSVEDLDDSDEAQDESDEAQDESDEAQDDSDEAQDDSEEDLDDFEDDLDDYKDLDAAAERIGRLQKLRQRRNEEAAAQEKSHRQRLLDIDQQAHEKRMEMIRDEHEMKMELIRSQCVRDIKLMKYKHRLNMHLLDFEANLNKRKEDILMGKEHDLDLFFMEEKAKFEAILSKDKEDIFMDGWRKNATE